MSYRLRTEVCVDGAGNNCCYQPQRLLQELPIQNFRELWPIEEESCAGPRRTSCSTFLKGLICFQAPSETKVSTLTSQRLMAPPHCIKDEINYYLILADIVEKAFEVVNDCNDILLGLDKQRMAMASIYTPK